MYTDEKIKSLIKKDHPEFTDEKVEDIFRRLDKISDILFNDWLNLKKMRGGSSEEKIDDSGS